MRFLLNLFRQTNGLRPPGAAAGNGHVSADDCVLASILKSRGMTLAFNMLEVGALPTDGQTEPFYRLMKLFPSSRLSGVEIDSRLCEELNRNAPANIRYYPCALGKAAETRHLYETAHPMCTSLYPPDERYADLFGNLEDMRLKRTSEIETISLDQCVRDYALGEIDFIKIDVQGAELEIFRGGIDVLRNLLFIICEVEFVPIYQGQPLFADVDASLRKHGFMLHKLLGMGGRVMKPLMAHGSPNYPVQFLWSDAVYVNDLFALDTMSGERLLKLAVLLELYDSKDVALHVLRRYDAANKTDLANSYLDQLNAGGPWQTVPPEIRDAHS